jgi:hypothetical protein
MNTERENNHGEYWADEGIYIRFNMKKVWAWLVSLFLLSGVCQAQVAYCGVDVASQFVPTGGVAKQTLSNLLTYSEQFDNAAWTKSNLTVTANSIAAPDGTTTADTIVNTVTNATHAINSASVTTVASSVYRISVYLKYGTYQYVVVRSQAPATAFVGVDMLNGIIAVNGSSTLSSRIRNVGNGWYEVDFTYAASGIADFVTINLTPSTYDASTSYIGTTAQNVYAWGASIQLASAPADYLQAVASTTSLGPLCPVGYTQSLTDPSRCFIVGPVTSRTIRTW